MNRILLLTVLFVLSLVSFAVAQIPQTMSYQGVLTDAAGNPVADGTVSLTFKLYDVATGGTALWEETQNVEVANGIFNVILGSVTNLNLPFDKPYWLGISIGQEAELTPRIALTAAPYSLNSNSTLVQPEPGQDLVIKNQAGEVTHIFSPNDGPGTASTSKRTDSLAGGRAFSVTKGKIYAFDLCIALPDPNEQSGLFPWSRFDSTGLRVRGDITANSFSIIQGIDTLTTFRRDGTSFHKGEETFAGGIKLQGQNGIIFADGTELKTAAAGGGSSGWVEDAANNTVMTSREVIIKDKDGKEKIRFNKFGSAKFLGNITVTDENNTGGLLLTQGGILFADSTGKSIFLLTSLGSQHFVPEEFEDDVILKGKDGKGIKLVDANGTTLAGFGRKDLQTGKRMGVFAKAEKPGDLAAAFEGPVDVLGEITASSLHIVNTNGDTLTNFNADGTSSHKGKESFTGGITIVNSDGSTAIDLQPNTDPNTEYAITINGNLQVNGIMMAETKQFKIDHPLDPENKYLLHTSIESPDMMNIYNGNVTLGSDGTAWVDMPDWFEALNGDFRYQLTCIGGFAQIYIAEEIQNNRFRIAGGPPGMKVSWQVTGIRHDAWAKSHRQPIEGYKR